MTTTPAEAQTFAAIELRAIYGAVTTWDTALLDQVVLHLHASGQPFGMNQIRTIAPDAACRVAGLYFHALLGQRELLMKVGEETSINKKAHGKPVNLYLLTRSGREFIEARQAERIAARNEQQRRAA